MIGWAAALTNLGDKDRAFRAKKQAFGSFFSLFPVSLCVDATEVAAAANPVFWQEDGSCMSGNGFLRLLFRSEIRLHGNAGKSLPLSPVSPAERTRLRSAEAPQRKPRAAPAKGGLEGMSKRGFLRLLFRPEIRRHGDVGKKPPVVTRVASRAHPLAGCRGAATEAARSAGKGRCGGNVETRISPAVTSLGNTTAWGRRRNPTARGSCSPRSGGKAP